jgi:hypothetical protein
MPGGLIQLVSHGASDAFLTGNPEITFFKIVYRRYTNFSMESIEKRFDSVPNFGKTVSCLIDSTGDLIHKIYLKIELPEVKFNNKNIISNSEYNQGRNILIKNLENVYLNDKTKYDNLYTYSKYNIDAYKILSSILLPDEINLQFVKSQILSFKSLNKDSIDSIKLLIDSKVVNDTDIISYILNFDNYSLDITEIRNEIKKNVESKYNKIRNYLKIYFKNYTHNYDKYLIVYNDQTINFAWIKNLGNFICENIELEIGGQIIESHNYYWRFIWDQISIDVKKKELYNKMIGNQDILTDFNTDIKPTYTLLIPLQFTFCKYAGMSLPLIALKYHDVKININFNKIENCCYLEDYHKEYNKVLYIEYNKDEIIYENNKLEDFRYNYELKLNNLKLDLDRDIYIYNFDYINRKVLNKNYNITDLDANYILNKYGSKKNDDNYFSMNLNEFIKMKHTEDDDKLTNIFKSSLDYHLYLNKKHILESINIVDASLLIDYIYLDEMERQKFAQSKHEYLIENIEENIIENLNNKKNLIDLSFRHPVKELFWFSQPKEYCDSSTPYRESKYYNFSDNFYQLENNKNPIQASQLELNNVTIFPKEVDSGFFNYVTHSKYHSNIGNLGLNLYSFSLYPEDQQPSGSCNFSSFKSKKLVINLEEQYYSKYKENNIVFRAFSLHYNVLRIMGGMGGMEFN